MKRRFFSTVPLLFLSWLVLVWAGGCDKGEKKTVNPDPAPAPATPPPQEAPKVTNPFFLDSYGTPYEMPPFAKIETAHFLPAFQKGMEEQNRAVKAIVGQKAAPTFANTILKLEYSGDLLSKVRNVFSNLSSADSNEELLAIKKRIAPQLTKHNDAIYFNAKLFNRVKYLYERQANLGLSKEQLMVLKKYYKEFVRGGANLAPKQKERLGALNKALAAKTVAYNEHLLKEIKEWKMVLDKPEQLKGLPSSVVKRAAEAAKSAGLNGKWLFTLNKPSWIPFLTYSTERALRERLYKGYINKGNNNNDYDNKKLIAEIAALRVKKARIMGYKTWAAYRLADNMAKTPKKVMALLNKLWKAALPMAKEEAKALQKLIRKEKKPFPLKSWDWWYYAEKLRKLKYDLDDEALRPYFKLDNVREGTFYVAKKLFGITFQERKDLPKYHKDVKTFEVRNAKGEVMGIYLVDYFPRPGKRGGAWMAPYRKQIRKEGKNVLPIIVNVCNFSKPVGDKPALLSFDEVTTLFHEFGHALHGLLSNCTYAKVSGTDTPLDYVEFPSQLLEHWALAPEVLSVYAKHYKTGQVIPKSLVEKIKKSRHFNQGFATTEYLAAALLDMEWHSLTTDTPRRHHKV